METLHWGLSAPFGGLHCTRVTFHKFRKCHFWELSTGAGGGWSSRQSRVPSVCPSVVCVEGSVGSRRHAGAVSCILPCRQQPEFADAVFVLHFKQSGHKDETTTVQSRPCPSAAPALCLLLRGRPSIHCSRLSFCGAGSWFAHPAPNDCRLRGTLKRVCSVGEGAPASGFMCTARPRACFLGCCVKVPQAGGLK